MEGLRPGAGRAVLLLTRDVAGASPSEHEYIGDGQEQPRARRLSRSEVDDADGATEVVSGMEGPRLRVVAVGRV